MTFRHTIRAALLMGALLSPLGTFLPALSQSTPVATPGAEPIHGIDVADMDLSVSPGDDFYQFANGGWLARTVIPADRPQVRTLQQLNDRAINQQIDLLRAAASPSGAAPGSDQAKAGAVFDQGLDMATRDQQGIEPIRDVLDRIAAIDSAADYHAYLGRAPFDRVGGTLPLSVLPDFKDSAINAVYLGEPALGLPNRDYYLDDDPANVAVQEAYVANAAALLTAVGYTPEVAATAAKAVYAFETSLAAATMSREQQQDYNLQYNPMTLDELAAAYPGMDWPAYLAALGVSGVDLLIVNDTEYLAALPDIMAATPVETLRAYLTLELVTAWADTLDTALSKTAFTFTQVLYGLDEQPRLEERVLGQVSGVLPDAVGQLYVAAYFPAEAKAAITELAENELAAFAERLEANTWMTPETKAKARTKLDATTIKVGYPARWESYAEVERQDSYAGSLRNALAAQVRKDFGQAGKPVNRDKWFLTSQTVNAQNVPFLNELVFPAAILQPPLFDYQADPAANYGAIGFVIGHELTHGFDLTGSQFDAEGNLNNWWTDEDRERFLALNEALAKQYSAIEVAPGLFVNGQITVTENVADLGGIQNAFAALEYELAQDGSLDATPSAPDAIVAPPFTSEQRFFVAASSVFRTKTRPAFLELQVRSDEHAPGVVRSTQPLRNADAFYAAFGIQPGDREWLSPEERIVIW